MLTAYDLTPQKSLGQNFLIDQNVLDKIIAAAALTPEDTVVEIGAGLGVMTRALLSAAGQVAVVEFDQRLRPLWKDYTAAHSHLSVLFQDILTVNLEAWLQAETPWQPKTGFKVCANIPYHITSPIIFQLLETCPHLSSAILMMQKEVAQRLVARPGGKDYGRLTLTTAYHAAVEPLMTVSRHCYFPEPSVDSMVVRFTPHAQKSLNPTQEIVFKNLLRAVFVKRRKTILNSMSAFWSLSKPEMSARLQALDLDPSARPENLRLEDYVALVAAQTAYED